MIPFDALQRVVLGGAPCALQASHTRHWPLRMAPLEASQRVVLGVASYTVQAPPSPAQATQYGLPRGTAECKIELGPIPPLGLSSSAPAAHDGPPWRHRRGWHWAWSLRPPGLSSSALATQDCSLRGIAEVVVGAAPYTLQASHPRHLPLRMAPFEASQRVVLCVAPTLSRPLIFGTGHPRIALFEARPGVCGGRAQYYCMRCL